MLCGTPDQVVASVLSLHHPGIDHSCAQVLREYWIDLYKDWPFPLTVYLPYFFVTLFLEQLSLFLFLSIQKTKFDWKWPTTCLIANLITHPAYCYVVPWISFQLRLRWDACTLVSEAFIILVEAWIYWKRIKISFRTALGIATITNLASWWIGSYLL